MRLLVAQPVLAAQIDHAALASLAMLAPDRAEMLTLLVEACRVLGDQANFASLSEQLREGDTKFDELIAEIAADQEVELETAQLELAGALRQTRMKVLKLELDQLAAGGLQDEKARQRFRELMSEQEQLRRQTDSSSANK